MAKNVLPVPAGPDAEDQVMLLDRLDVIFLLK